MFSKNAISKILILKKLGVINRSLSVLKECKKKPNNQAEIDKLVAKYKDLFYYSSFLEDSDIIYGYKRIKTEKFRNKIKLNENKVKDVLPLSLRLLNKDLNVENMDYLNESKNDDEKVLRLKITQPPEDASNWLHDYENYTEEETFKKGATVKIGRTPCSGCGAILHCDDETMPGFIPAEIYNNSVKPDGAKLQDVICQRCHFLKVYNQALNVQVSPNDYLKVLSKVYSHGRCLVILLVDLLDFPCSIWPGMQDLIGVDKEIFVVGNKVDLLQINDPNNLEHIKSVLYKSIIDAGFAEDNVKYVSLISAKTGYGIEDLITNLFYLWRYKGDVILIGCTNVGKSTLFNTLINSDYCKYYMADSIQRATTSSWPGTTINLLKFPILRLNPGRLEERIERIKALQQFQGKVIQFTKINVGEKERHKYIIPSENYLENTFKAKLAESGDLFSVPTKINKLKRNDEKLERSNFFYDTPGVVQPEQITDLLTLEELELLFPKEFIKPKTFSLYPNSSIFIAGLGRLDLLEGLKTTRFTVFCSSNLPITICKTSDAEEIYKTFLGTELLGIPGIKNEKLKTWPELMPCPNFVVKGIHRHTSCKDVVLSSAGWVSITPNAGVECTVRAWTPNKKGIYLRDSILPRAVYYRGKRLKYSCSYASNLEYQY